MQYSKLSMFNPEIPKPALLVKTSLLTKNNLSKAMDDFFDKRIKFLKSMHIGNVIINS